jgi:hypothetical protein
MKAVSSIIVIILILLIVVALAAMLWLFMSTLFTTVSTSSSQSFKNTANNLGGCLKIENFDPNSKNITVRNCGFSSASNFNIYSDSQLISTYSGTINPGSIANINLNIPSGVHTIQVSSTSTQSFTKQVSISQTCSGVQPPQYGQLGDWNIISDTICTCASGENITMNGIVYVKGSATFNLNGCKLITNETGTQFPYDPALSVSETAKMNMINSVFNTTWQGTQQYVAIYYFGGSSINYIESSILDQCGSGCNFGGNSKNTIRNSQVPSNHYIHVQGNTEMIFDNTFINEWHSEGEAGTATVRGNFTLGGGQVNEWASNAYINRYIPVVITDTAGNAKSATVNITNKTNGALIWGPQSVNGYAEPNIMFNYTNYLPGNFILYVYAGSQVNSTDLNFLNTTPIRLTL